MTAIYLRECFMQFMLKVPFENVLAIDLLTVICPTLPYTAPVGLFLGGMYVAVHLLWYVLFSVEYCLMVTFHVGQPLYGGLGDFARACSLYWVSLYNNIPLLRPLENKTTPLLRPSFTISKRDFLVILHSSR